MTTYTVEGKTQFVSNTDFESGTSGWSGSPGEGTLTWDTNAHSGTHALKMTRMNSHTVPYWAEYSYSGLTIGREYTVVAWANNAGGSAPLMCIELPEQEVTSAPAYPSGYTEYSLVFTAIQRDGTLRIENAGTFQYTSFVVDDVTMTTDETRLMGVLGVRSFTGSDPEVFTEVLATLAKAHVSFNGHNAGDPFVVRPIRPTMTASYALHAALQTIVPVVIPAPPVPAPEEDPEQPGVFPIPAWGGLTIRALHGVVVDMDPPYIVDGVPR